MEPEPQSRTIRTRRYRDDRDPFKGMAIIADNVSLNT